MIDISVALITAGLNIMVWRGAMRRPEPKYRRWKVILGVILFMALMGIAGTSDLNSKQIVLDEKIYTRDRVKIAVEADYNEWTAYYVARSIEGK